MKPRTPKSFAAAITKVRARMSDRRCAEIVHRSESLIRKWADPDHPSLPNVLQALALDIAYARGGNGAPPIFKVYQDLISDRLDRNRKQTVDIVLSALSVQGVVGDLSEAIRSAADPAGPGGIVFTPRERTKILQLLETLDDKADLIEDAVEEED